MNVPANLKYTKDHEWIKVDGDVATIGVTDFAQSQLGDIVFIEIETVGETLANEEVFGTIEAVKTVSDMFMGAGYRFENLPLIFESESGDKKALKSDLRITVDFSIRENTTVLRQLVEGTNETIAGQLIDHLS